MQRIVSNGDGSYDVEQKDNNGQWVWVDTIEEEEVEEKLNEK